MDLPVSLDKKIPELNLSIGDFLSHFYYVFFFFLALERFAAFFFAFFLAIVNFSFHNKKINEMINYRYKKGES